jgi:hypothetical protein
MEGFAEFVREALPGLSRYGHLLADNPHDAAADNTAPGPVGTGGGRSCGG